MRRERRKDNALQDANQRVSVDFSRATQEFGSTMLDCDDIRRGAVSPFAHDIEEHRVDVRVGVLEDDFVGGELVEDAAQRGAICRGVERGFGQLVPLNGRRERGEQIGAGLRDERYDADFMSILRKRLRQQRRYRLYPPKRRVLMLVKKDLHAISFPLPICSSSLPVKIITVMSVISLVHPPPDLTLQRVAITIVFEVKVHNAVNSRPVGHTDSPLPIANSCRY